MISRIIILFPHYNYNDTSSIKRAFINGHSVIKKAFTFYHGIIIILISMITKNKSNSYIFIFNLIILLSIVFILKYCFKQSNKI